VRRESSAEFKKVVLEALAEGCMKLEKKAEAKRHFDSAAKLAGQGKDLKISRAIFANLIKP
jgi:hypothetical protein